MKDLKKFKAWACTTRVDFRLFHKKEVACGCYSLTILASSKQEAEKMIKGALNARLVYVEELKE